MTKHENRKNRFFSKRFETTPAYFPTCSAMPVCLRSPNIGRRGGIFAVVRVMYAA